MAINIMANYKNQNEHDLMQDLIEEAIEQRGAYVRYIVRDMLNPDFLLGESSMSDFKEGYQLPMFIESVEHFNGNGDIFDAFGIAKIDSSIFQVGSRKFRLEVSEKSGLERPREGDLIYLPLSDSLWEIKKVKLDLKYYQLGKNYSYRLVCKLFLYSHEEIDNPESPVDLNNSEDLLEDKAIREALGLEPKKVLTLDPSTVMDDQAAIEERNMESKITPPGETFGF